MMCKNDDNSRRRLRSKVRNFQGINLAMMMLWQAVMRSGTSLKSVLGGKQQRLDTQTFPILFTGPQTGLSGMHPRPEVQGH
jgi:hypothetical protein